MISNSFVLIAVVLTIPLTLAACGGDDDDETTAASDTTTTEETTTEDTTSAEATGGGGGGETVDISEVEFAIDPKDVTTKAGEVTFAIANDGSVPHNLEVEGGIEEVSKTIQGGQKTDLTVNLEPGEYEMYCAIPGHREQGMEGTVTVQ